MHAAPVGCSKDYWLVVPTSLCTDRHCESGYRVPAGPLVIGLEERKSLMAGRPLARVT